MVLVSLAALVGGLSFGRGDIRRERDVLPFMLGLCRNFGFFVRSLAEEGNADQHLIKWNSCLCTVFNHDPHC